MAVPLRLDGLLAKIESVYATDAAPVVGTDGVRVTEHIWPSTLAEHLFLNQRLSASGSILPEAPAPRTGRKVSLGILWDARGAGAAYSASVLPEADALFRSCGLARTDDFTVSSENVIYNQANTGHDSCTIHAYAGTKLYKIVGCRGSVRWGIEAGAFGVIGFDMQGLLIAAPTEVANPSITLDATVPPTAVGLSESIGSWTPDLVSAEFNQNATVVQLPSANATDGIAGFEISEVNPQYTASAKLATIATFDPWATMKAATAVTLDRTLGTVQYNRIKFDVTSGAYLESITNSDQDSFAGIDMVFQLTSFGITFD